MPISKVIRGHRMATVSAYISAGIDVIDLTCTDTLLGRERERNALILVAKLSPNFQSHQLKLLCQRLHSFVSTLYLLKINGF